MVGKRKPNPTHIIRYEYVSACPGRNGWRDSWYQHGVHVPNHLVERIKRDGSVIETHEQSGGAETVTWTVGHIVWPGDHSTQCAECPYEARP